jgi:hypothetical protein
MVEARQASRKPGVDIVAGRWNVNAQPLLEAGLDAAVAIDDL